MIHSEFYESIDTSSIMSREAWRIMLDSFEGIFMEEVDVSRTGTRGLKPLCTVRPSKKSAAIPVVANGRTIFPVDQITI